MIKRGFMVFTLAVVFAIIWSYVIDNHVFAFLRLGGVWSGVVFTAIVFAIVSCLLCYLLVVRKVREELKHKRGQYMFVSSVICFSIMGLCCPIFYMLFLYTG